MAAAHRQKEMFTEKFSFAGYKNTSRKKLSGLRDSAVFSFARPEQKRHERLCGKSCFIFILLPKMKTAGFI